MITDQYYENNCYHVTMASEEKDLMISCQHLVDSHVLDVSTTLITHVRLIRPIGFCSDCLNGQYNLCGLLRYSSKQMSAATLKETMQ